MVVRELGMGIVAPNFCYTLPTEGDPSGWGGYLMPLENTTQDTCIMPGKPETKAKWQPG